MSAAGAAAAYTAVVDEYTAMVNAATEEVLRHLRDPDPAAWAAWLAQPRLADSRGMFWEPEEYLDCSGHNGHVWRGTRGPYSFCHRAGCRLPYSRWDGINDCAGIGPEHGPWLPTAHEVAAMAAELVDLRSRVAR